MLTGRLSGTVEGRPVEIICEGDHIRLDLQGVLTAWRLRGRSVGAAAVLEIMSRVGLGLSLSLGMISLPVLPQPHPVVRWFGPEFDDI